MDKDIVQKDLRYNWHPYTQMKDCEEDPPVAIEHAEGIKLYDHDGNFYYDTISSWWCNVHGHNHPYITGAVKRQLDRLEHVLFAGFTHEGAAELAERLVKISPDGLERVFFSDNGSTAVETALKMSVQYWQNIGIEGRTKFLALDKGYHGDTIGAMSVSGVDLYNKRFKPLFFGSFKAPAPDCFSCPAGKMRDSCSVECLSGIEKILKERSGEIAAVIVEPLLMGAAGMIIYPAEYLKGVGELARKYDVHLIVDEVATGFGRTGKMFASEHAGIEPDFMCLSKGLTSGYMPMGATLTTGKIYDAFYADRSEYKTFYHGHTYTANPLACAAAIAGIDLFEKENALENVRRINEKLTAFLEEISSLDIVENTRSIGAVGAFNVKLPATRRIYRRSLKRNLILRPLGDVVYFFLPLCTTGEELEDIFCRAREMLYNINLEVKEKILSSN